MYQIMWMLKKTILYSQLKKEGLACVICIKHFHLYLFGHKFVLQTDHQPLVTDCLVKLKLFQLKHPTIFKGGHYS